VSSTNPDLLRERVARSLRDNPHRVVVVMKPEAGHEVAAQRQEAELLKTRVAALTEADRRHVLEDGKKLLEKQALGDDASSLPILDVLKIADAAERPVLRHETVSTVPVQLSEQPTNGVTYFRGVLNTSGVPPYFRPLLPLFCQLVTRMGTHALDYRAQDQREQLWTGGLSANLAVTDDPAQPGRYEEGILLRSYCLEHNTTNMFQLWEDIFGGVMWDNAERMGSLLQMAAAELANSVPAAGHQYAMGVAGAGLSGSARLRQLYSGLDQVRFMKQLVTDGELPMLVTKMKMLGDMLLMKDGMRCALNGTAAGLPAAVSALDSLLTRTVGEGRDDIQVCPDHTPAGEKTYVELPLPVHYAAHAVPTVPYSHADFASLRVLARLLSLGHLHREIREKGGAYGGGAIASPGGTWSFYSYRDPNSLATLDVFAGAVDYVRDHAFSAEDLAGAKLGVFQAVDAPVVPADRGMRRFLSRISDEQFDEHRRLVKAVTVEDLRRVSEQYLRAPPVAGTCVLGKRCEGLGGEWKVVQS